MGRTFLEKKVTSAPGGVIQNDVHQTQDFSSSLSRVFIRYAIALIMTSRSTVLLTINPLFFAISVRSIAADLFAKFKKPSPFS